MLKAVFFDLDNTLIDRDAAHAAWCRQVAAESMRDVNVLVAEMIRRDQGGYGDRLTYFAWIASQLGKGLDGLGLFVEHQESIASFVKPNPIAKRVLKELRQKVPVAIVTNGNGETQRAKLRAAGLVDVVDAVFVSGEVGYHKPDRRIFQHALDSLRLNSEDVLFVGDDLVRDVLGARKAGMRSCWVQRTQPDLPDADPPDFVVNSVSELVPLLRGAFS